MREDAGSTQGHRVNRRVLPARRWILWLLPVLAGLGVAPALPAEKAPAETEPPAEESSPSKPGALILEEKPELFVPKQPRSEAEQDRLDALALFSAARIHEQRQEYDKALRLYQRAYRRDPQAATIVRSIVPLAARLERHAEAVRYALKLVELDDVDTLLLKRLAVYLTDTGDYSKALALYEKATAAAKGKVEAQEVVLWMEMGRLYHLLEKYDKAAEQFNRVLEVLDHPERFGLDGAVKKTILGEPEMAYLLMGEAFFAAGQYPKAADAFERSNQAQANKGLLSYNLARIEARTGKPEKALEKLQVYFDERQAAAGMAPYRLLAEVLKGINKEGDLLPRLERLRGDDPANVPLGYFLAERYLEAGQADKAQTLYRELVKKTPTTVGLRNLIALERKAKQYDALLKTLGEAVQNFGSLEPLADKDRALGDDADLVRGLFDAARKQLAADPKSLSYERRVALALVAQDARQFDQADEFFDLAIQARPDQAAKVLLTWGLDLLVKEEPARSAKVFQRGVETRPDDPAFPFYLAGALEMSGRTEEALAAARKALELTSKEDAKPGLSLSGLFDKILELAGQESKKPADAPKTSAKTGKRPGKKPERSGAGKEQPRFLARIAWILYHAKRYDEAAKAYTALIAKYEADYRSEEIRQAVREARLILSNIAVIRREQAKSVEWLEAVLDEFPDDPSASNDLGYLWAEQGKHLLRARQMIERAVQAEPDNGAYRDSLGWVLFQQGKHREAVAELEKAVELDKNSTKSKDKKDKTDADPTILEHLGDAYQALGEQAKAKDAWRRAAEAYGKSEEPEKAKKVEAKMGGK